MSIAEHLIKAFTPTGKLRASINLGNPVLAGKDASTGQPAGVSIDLAQAFANRLGVALELAVFATAAKSVDALVEGQADLGFFAIDPLRGKEIAFTAPYLLIEGCYMVRNDSPITSNDQVDRAGHRIAVGQGSAYDLYLSRELKQAEIVRASSAPAVTDLFLEQRLEVAAGVRQMLVADARRHPDLRLLPGRFMVIRQAMATPKQRGEAAADLLRQFVEQMKASGFVADALARHGIAGAAVAPPESL
jgi:polar amino acid transport system substrate-binding protein